MKIITPFSLLIMLLTACNNTSENGSTGEFVHQAHSGSNAASGHTTHSNPDLSHLQLATDTDTTCGMPLSAGVSDTLVLKGKVYGFCTPACKKQFAELLAAEPGSDITTN